MTRRSRVGVLGAVGALAAVATLTGCDRPTPLVTAEANGHVVTTNAACYARGGVLRQYAGSEPALRVSNGDRVSFDVPRSMADDGWKVVLTTTDQSQSEPVATVAKGQHHVSIAIPSFTSAGTVLAIVTTGATGCTAGEKVADRSGAWAFRLNVGPS